MINLNKLQSEIEKGNKLLALLVEIVIDTHNYEPMEKFRERLKELS